MNKNFHVIVHLNFTFPLLEPLWFFLKDFSSSLTFKYLLVIFILPRTIVGRLIQFAFRVCKVRKCQLHHHVLELCQHCLELLRFLGRRSHY